MFCMLDTPSSPRRWIGLFVGAGGMVLFLVTAFRIPSLQLRLPDSAAVATSDAERQILAALTAAEDAGETFANVGPEDGRLLRMMVETTGARNVVEIGTSTGISGLWLSMGLVKTGGTLHTFEIDPGRAAIARRHFEHAGVLPVVDLIEGDAHKELQKLEAPVDLVFIDAEKSGYVDYLNQLLPRLRPGGLMLAHNVRMVPEYLAAITANPDLDTVYYMQGGGMAVTLKKR